MSTQPAYIIAHHVLTPLGNGTATNLDAVVAGYTGVKENLYQVFQGQGICGSLFSPDDWNNIRSAFDQSITRFEALLLSSIIAAVQQAGWNPRDKDTVLILASTKGNIGNLSVGEESQAEQAGLHRSAKNIAQVLGYQNQPILVSNACISGMTALLIAKRLLQAGFYKKAIVAGADCISPFIMAGFKSFQALSSTVCRPFDKDRNGLNLGEGAATILLSLNKTPHTGAILSGGATTNDANHISGPSRTGQEMAHAIRMALQYAAVPAAEIGFISAHGTATPYNDEMESKAFLQAGLDKTPAFSLKPCFGHTLGAAGLIESAISLEALQRGWIIPSYGYTNHGVSAAVTIAEKLTKSDKLNHFIKTGSGFGGCNAALVFSKTSTQ